MTLNDYPLIAAMLIAAGVTAMEAADASDTSGSPTEAADAKIFGVTVYADRARVTRSATVPVPAGAAPVVICGLTTNIHESTVLESQIALLNARKSFFENLSAGISRSDKGPPQVDDLKKIYDFYSDELTTVSNSLLDTHAKLHAQQLEIDRLKQEMSGLTQQKSSRKVVISVQAEKPDMLELTLFYTVHNASWEPIYDARLNTTDGSVLLSYNAYVSQKTGEEWDGVKLSVSTARPAEKGQLPELNPLYLSLNSPIPTEPSAT